MYKTVRQGENSLQYTILPQTEEVLTSSGGKGRGRDYSPSAQGRRLNKRLIFYYIAVFLFAILLVLGAVLVVLIITGVVPVDLPARIDKERLAEIMGQTGSLQRIQHYEKSPTRKKELSRDMRLMKTNYKTTDTTPTTTTSIDLEELNQHNQSTTLLATIIQIVATSTYQTPTANKDWATPSQKTLQSSTTLPPSTATEVEIKSTAANILSDGSSSAFAHQRESNTDLMLGHDQLNWKDYDDDDDEDYDLTKPVTTPVVNTNKPPLMINKSAKEIMTKQTTTQGTVATPLKPTTISSPSSNNTSESLNSTLEKARNKTKMDAIKFMDIKEKILDDDDEEYKEPLADEEDVAEQPLGDDVKMSQAKSSWLQNKWPFVDPSSYFQWTDYSARDNLLLPAILSAAVSALLVLAVLCYALRRRQRCRKRIQDIGNLTSDLQAEDNAILLTAENPSEED